MLKVQGVREATAAAGVDALALLAFSALGLLSHGEPVTGGGVARNFLPLLLAWFLLSLPLGTYSRGGLGRLLANWALGVPLGVLLRGLILGRPFGRPLLVFMGVATALSGLFLALGRLALAAAMTAWRERREQGS
jgi:hypothetical protein